MFVCLRSQVSQGSHGKQQGRRMIFFLKAMTQTHRR